MPTFNSRESLQRLFSELTEGASIGGGAYVLNPCLLLAANSHPSLIDDPEATGEWLTLEKRDHARYQIENGGLVLARRSQHDGARVLIRWRCPDVRESDIERNDGALLPDGNFRYFRVGRAGERLLVHRRGIVARGSGHIRHIAGEVLVDLESHEALRARLERRYAGNAMTRSLARSAA